MKRKIPILFTVLAAVFVIITGVWLTQTNQRLVYLNQVVSENKETEETEEKQNKETEETQTYSSVDINAPAYKGKNTEKLKEQIKKLEFKNKVYSTTSEDFKALFSDYVNARYNYNGTSKDCCNKVLKAIYPYVNADVLDSVKEEMNEPLVGNGVISDDFQHTGKLVNLYLDKIIKVGTNSNLDVPIDYKDTYMIEGYAKIYYNEGMYMYSAVMFSTDYEHQDWKITYDNNKKYVYLNF